MERDQGALLRRAETTTQATTPIRASRNGLFVRMAQIANPAAHNHHATGCRERRRGAAARVIPRPADGAIGRRRDPPRAATTAAIRTTGRRRSRRPPTRMRGRQRWPTMRVGWLPVDPWRSPAGPPDRRCPPERRGGRGRRPARGRVVVATGRCGRLRPRARCWSLVACAGLPRSASRASASTDGTVGAAGAPSWWSAAQTVAGPAVSRSTHCRSVRRTAPPPGGGSLAVVRFVGLEPPTFDVVGRARRPTAPPGRRWRRPTTPRTRASTTSSRSRRTRRSGRSSARRWPDSCRWRTAGPSCCRPRCPTPTAAASASASCAFDATGTHVETVDFDDPLPKSTTTAT